MAVYDEFVDYGDSKKCTASFVNDVGVASDPDTVRFLYTTPSGVTTTLVYGIDVEVTRSSAGVYSIVVVFNESGIWKVRVESETSVIAASERRVYCRRSLFY